MKSCKSCFKEIDDRATKCPHCQAFQTKWRNPQFISLLIVLPIMAIPLYTLRSLNKPAFADYKNDVVLTEQKSIADDRDSGRFILEVDNRTGKKWEDPMVRIIFKGAGGEIVGVANEEEHRFLALPKSKSLFEVHAKIPAGATSHTVELISMRAPILQD